MPNRMHIIDDITDGVAEIKDLYPHFENKIEALKYYASVMCARYSENTETERCQLCDHMPVVWKLSYNWHATVSRRIGINILKSILLLPLAFLIIFIPMMKIPDIRASAVGVNLCTAFNVCEACHRAAQRRCAFASFLGFFFGFAIFVGFCGTFFIGIMEIAMMMNWLEPFPVDEMPEFHNTFFVSVVALIIARISMHPVLNFIILPDAVRRLIKKPFKFVNFIGF